MSYLLTRHATTTVGHQTYPGLFSIHSFGQDSVLFVLVLIVELLGLWLLVHGYWDRYGIEGFGDEGAMIPVVAASGAFLVDVLAALFHHWPYAKKLSLFRNEMMLPRARRWTSDQDGNKRWVSNDLQWRLYLSRHHGLRLFQILSLFSAVVIILLAFGKILAIQMFLPTSSGSNMKLIVTISYLLCAFLHISVSGYFLSAITTKWGFPPFIPLFFQQKGELQEKSLHLSLAIHTQEASFQRECADFKPFECLLDGESPFDLRATEVSEDPSMKELDGAYHCLSIVERELAFNSDEILKRYGLDSATLDSVIRDIHISDEKWVSLLDELGAFPTVALNLPPETVAEALKNARNTKLRTLVDRRYVFSTYGLLRDEHLRSFLGDQPGEAKAVMLRWGHLAQMQQLQQS